jgi:hypothetical protein
MPHLLAAGRIAFSRTAQPRGAPRRAVSFLGLDLDLQDVVAALAGLADLRDPRTVAHDQVCAVLFWLTWIEVVVWLRSAPVRRMSSFLGGKY